LVSPGEGKTRPRLERVHVVLQPKAPVNRVVNPSRSPRTAEDLGPLVLVLFDAGHVVGLDAAVEERWRLRPSVEWKDGSP
jgi:hypothetical protein